MARQYKPFWIIADRLPRSFGTCGVHRVNVYVGSKWVRIKHAGCELRCVLRKSQWEDEIPHAAAFDGQTIGQFMPLLRGYFKAQAPLETTKDESVRLRSGKARDSAGPGGVSAPDSGAKVSRKRRRGTRKGRLARG